MPGSSGAIEAGGAFVRLFTEDSALVRGLESAEKRLRDFGKHVSEFGKKMVEYGGAGLLPLAGAAKLFANMGDELHHAAVETGIPVQKLSLLKAAAEESGVGFEGLTAALFKMEAAFGSGQANQHLAALGISLEEISGLSADEQFLKIAEALEKVDNVSSRNAIAKGIFGKGVAAILPLLEQGRAGILRNMGQAGAHGMGWSEADVKQAREFNKELAKMEGSAKMAAAQVGRALVPDMISLFQWGTKAARMAAEWVREHRQVVVTAAAVSAGLVGAGAGFLAVGKSVQGIASIVGTAGSALGTLLSPGGLLVAGTLAVAGGLAYLWSQTDSGKETVTSLRDTWGNAWEGMAKDIEGGRIKHAFEVLMKSLEITWLKFWASVRKEVDEQIDKLTPKQHQEHAGEGLPGILNAALGGWKMWFAANSAYLHKDSKHWLEDQRQKIIDETEGTGRNLNQMKQSGSLYGQDKIKQKEGELDKLLKDADLAAKARLGMGVFGKVFDLLHRQDQGEGGSMGLLAGAGQDAKGTFSSYALGQSLALADRGQERIITATEKTAQNTEGLKDKLGEVADALAKGGLLF